jgi:hypothetical protein
LVEKSYSSIDQVSPYYQKGIRKLTEELLAPIQSFLCKEDDFIPESLFIGRKRFSLLPFFNGVEMLDGNNERSSLIIRPLLSAKFRKS